VNNSGQQLKPSDVANSHENRGGQRLNRRFAFEADSDCLPMYVKRTLDRLALKLGRGQWLSMTDRERASIGELSTGSKQDCEAGKEMVREILRRYGTEPTELPQNVERLSDPRFELPAAVIESSREVGVCLRQERWSELSTDQRYALTKLVDPGKKNKRKRALMEFLGVAR